MSQVIQHHTHQQWQLINKHSKVRCSSTSSIWVMSHKGYQSLKSLTSRVFLYQVFVVWFYQLKLIVSLWCAFKLCYHLLLQQFWPSVLNFNTSIFIIHFRGYHRSWSWHLCWHVSRTLWGKFLVDYQLFIVLSKQLMCPP